MEAMPLGHEGAMGYMGRLLALNASNLREVLSMQGPGHRRHVLASDATLFSGLSGVPKPWFDWRLPQWVKRDRWSEVELFGHRWRSDWLLRDTRQQVCAKCIADHGYMRFEWDLQPYVACHIHGTVLQDACHTCGKAILPTRPGLEVCGCTGFLTSHQQPAEPAPEAVVRWSCWLACRLDPVAQSSTHEHNSDAPMLCDGASPDGAYRIVQAMAGGTREYKGARMTGLSPWLSTRCMVDLLNTGMETLEQLAKGARFGRPPDKACAGALAEQMHRGVTAWDRALAAQLLTDLRIKARRTRGRRYLEQMELFGDAP